MGEENRTSGDTLPRYLSTYIIQGKQNLMIKTASRRRAVLTAFKLQTFYHSEQANNVLELSASMVHRHVSAQRVS